MRDAAPRGYNSVSPYLMVESVEKELEFLKAVFGAEVNEELLNNEGQVWHGEARIGDTIVMLGKAQQDYQSSPSMLYIWVEDVDGTYQRALSNAGKSVSEPADQFYGNREAGIQDPHGNTWWIAHEIEKLSNEEVKRRLMEQRKKRL